MDKPRLTPITKEQLEASWDFVERTWKEAFKDVPCPCPNCPGHKGA